MPISKTVVRKKSSRTRASLVRTKVRSRSVVKKSRIATSKRQSSTQPVGVRRRNKNWAIVLLVLMCSMAAVTAIKYLRTESANAGQYQEAAFAYQGPAVQGASTATGQAAANRSDFIWPIARSDWPKTTKPILGCNLGDNNAVLSSLRLMVPRHTKVYAATDGEVVAAPKNNTLVIIKSKVTHQGKALYLTYDNLAKKHVNTTTKKHVTKGQLIAESGNTTPQYGNSLVFGIWKTSKLLPYESNLDTGAGRNIAGSVVHPLNYLPQDDRNIATCPFLSRSGDTVNNYYQVPGSSQRFLGF